MSKITTAICVSAIRGYIRREYPQILEEHPKNTFKRVHKYQLHGATIRDFIATEVPIGAKVTDRQGTQGLSIQIDPIYPWAHDSYEDCYGSCCYFVRDWYLQMVKKSLTPRQFIFSAFEAQGFIFAVITPVIRWMFDHYCYDQEISWALEAILPDEEWEEVTDGTFSFSGFQDVTQLYNHLIALGFQSDRKFDAFISQGLSTYYTVANR